MLLRPHWNKMKEGLLASLPLVLVFISAALFLIGFYLLKESQATQTVVYDVASAILTGGVFAAVLKSFQFIGIFRDALADAIYREPQFLAKLNLPLLLRDLFAASIAPRFPELPKLMSTAVFDDYLNFAQDCYYKNMHRRITILSYDATNDILELGEEFRLTIKAIPEQPVDYTFKIRGEHPGAVAEVPCKVISLTVDNISYDDKVTSETNTGVYKLSYAITLRGKDTYNVSRIMRRKHALATDPFLKAVSTRFLEKAELIVENRIPKLVGYELTAVGLDDEVFVTDKAFGGKGTAVEMSRWTVDRLIFPRQGYILAITKRP